MAKNGRLGSIGGLQRGAPGDAGERGEAELGDAGLPLQGGVHLLKLVGGASKADLQSFDLAEPSLADGSGDASLQSCPLGGAWPE